MSHINIETEGPDSKWGERAIVWLYPGNAYGRVIVMALPRNYHPWLWTHNDPRRPAQLTMAGLEARVREWRSKVRERYPGWSFRSSISHGDIELQHVPLDMLEEIGRDLGRLANELVAAYQDEVDPPVLTQEERFAQAAQRGWLRPANEEEKKAYYDYCRDVAHFPAITLSVGGKSGRSGRIAINYDTNGGIGGDDPYCTKWGMPVHYRAAGESLRGAAEGYRLTAKWHHNQRFSVWCGYTHVGIGNFPPELLEELADHIVWHIREYLTGPKEEK